MKEKKYNLELIRVISFIFVIGDHAANYYCRGFKRISGLEYAFSMTANVFVRICVPCFFMISGVLLLGRLDPVKKSLKKAWRFLIPLLFWTLVYSLFNRYAVTKQPIVPLNKLWTEPAEAHLWYMYALIPITLAIPFMQVIINNMKKEHEIALLIIGAIAVLCLFFFKDTYAEIPWFGTRGHCVYYFYLGYFINKYKDDIPLKNWHLATIFIVVSLANAAIGIVHSREIQDFWQTSISYKNPLIVITSAVFFLFMLRLGNGDIKLSDKVRKWVDTVCDCSFGIYLSHIMFLNLYMEFVRQRDLSAFIAIPMLMIVITSIAFAFTYVVRKIPGGKWIT